MKTTIRAWRAQSRRGACVTLLVVLWIVLILVSSGEAGLTLEVNNGTHSEHVRYFETGASAACVGADCAGARALVRPNATDNAMGCNRYSASDGTDRAWVLVPARGGCSAPQKMIRAREANATGIILVVDGEDTPHTLAKNLVSMVNLTNTDGANDLVSVYVTQESGERLYAFLAQPTASPQVDFPPAGHMTLGDYTAFYALTQAYVCVCVCVCAYVCVHLAL
jgi:hypothetical protein